MSKNLQLKMGSVLSYLQMALNILIGIIYTPLMLNLLGQSEYGLYSTVASTISMLSILNLGFSAGYIKYYSKYRINGDNEKIYKLNGLFIVIFSLIGLIALACGLFMTTNLELFFSDGLSNCEYQTARILMLLLSIRMALSFPLSVFSNIITAHERFIFIKICGMISTVLSPLITLLLLFMGYGSIAMVVVTVVLGTITDLVYVYYVIVKLHQKFYFYEFERRVCKELFTYTVFIAINIIVDQINWNIDKILLARFKGTTMVAIYSVGYSLYVYYMSFSTSISSVFTPRIHQIVNETELDSKEQKEYLTDLFVKVGRIQFLILGWIASGLVLFGKQFIVYFWAGINYEDSYYVMVLLTLSASIALIQNLGIEIQRAENRHKFRSVAYAIMAIANLLLSIILCQLYGAIGSAIGTALSLILANGLVMNIYYHKRCNIDIVYFWKNIIVMSKGLVIPSVVGVILNSLTKCNTVGSFVGAISLYSIVYFISVWILSMNSTEKDLIKKPIMKVVKRK